MTTAPVDGGDLQGRRAIVTGATGGLGREVCHHLRRAGCRVVLTGRRRRALDALAQGLGSEWARAAELDVRDAPAVERAVAAAADAWGGLDLVVNAAAVDPGWADVGDMELSIWEETIATNLSGTYYVCRAALPILVAGGGGVIVNVTSVAGHRAWPQDAAYNASKAGVELLTRTIAVEYATRGVRAVTVVPGVIDAGMTDIVTGSDERRELVAMHPMGRMGTPAEVAQAVAFLASDAASFTTGSSLAVDGGFLA